MYIDIKFTETETETVSEIETEMRLIRVGVVTGTFKMAESGSRGRR